MNDLDTLNGALAVTSLVYEASESAVVTSKLEVLAKAQPDVDDWLSNHCEIVRDVTEKLERPLSELVAIHAIKLRAFLAGDKKKTTRVSSAKTRQAM